MDKRRKDPSDKRSVPTRANSTMDSEEQEFWNLGDAEEGPPQQGAQGLGDGDAAPEGAIDLKEEDVFDDIDDSGSNEEEDAANDNHDGPSLREDAAPGTPASPPAGRPTSGKGEKVALGALGVILLIGIIWGVTVFIGTLPQGNDKDLVKFPLQGTSVTIAAANTYWRKPDRDKDKGIRMDTRLIPAAVIKLNDNPGSCALRFFFSDDKGDLVGDSTTHTATAGQFAASGTNEIEVHSTAGFADPGDHAAYTTEQIDTWHLVIMEGPDANARGSEFQEIARVPISFDRR